MKSFFQFLNEAQSQASMQASKLNLKSDGHGGWLDSRGKFVATTEDGKLKFVDKKKAKGEEETKAQPKAQAKPEEKEKKAKAPETAPKKSSGDDEAEGGSGETTETLTVAFGRFNPPTVGHGKLLSAAKKAAAGEDLKIYPSRTQDTKNGELYNFENIRVISAGVRDSDAEGVEGMSASKMRKAVSEDDFESFRKGTPKELDDGDTTALFDAVRAGMKVKKKKKEVTELWQIAPKCDPRGLREQYVGGFIYRMGDLVEHLNTGLIKEEYMFKSWIRDVMEYTEKKMNRRMRVPQKPNTLVGTDGYLKNAMAATGTTSIKNFINKYKKQSK